MFRIDTYLTNSYHKKIVVEDFKFFFALLKKTGRFLRRWDLLGVFLGVFSGCKQSGMWQHILHAGHICRDVISGWAEWVLAHLEFRSSVNPIPTKGQIMPTTLLFAHLDLKT